MSKLGSFVWSIADQLRGVYKPHKYGDVILPMTILRRLDAVMADKRAEMLALVESTANDAFLEARVKQSTGLPFFNRSQWTFEKLVAEAAGLEGNLTQGDMVRKAFSNEQIKAAVFELLGELAYDRITASEAG